MKDLFYLSATQFNRIKPYFPLSHGVPRVDDVRVISGIIYVIAMVCNGRMPRGNTGRTRRCITVSCAGVDWACSTASLRNWRVKRKRPRG
jgi:transposase